MWIISASGWIFKKKKKLNNISNIRARIVLWLKDNLKTTDACSRSWYRTY